MASTLEKELFGYILQLDEAEKKSVLQMLKTFLKGRNKDASQINIGQYNREIDEAIARVESGEFFSQDEVDKMSKDW
jgi:hypothetical protein